MLIKILTFIAGYVAFVLFWGKLLSMNDKEV